MGTKNKIQEELNERQEKYIDLISMATEGCEHKPALKIGKDSETSETIAGCEIESGDEDIIIAIRTKDIEVGVSSDDESREGYYGISPEYEHLFIGDLINAIWTNDYEQLFERMFATQQKEAA